MSEVRGGQGEGCAFVVAAMGVVAVSIGPADAVALQSKFRDSN